MMSSINGAMLAVGSSPAAAMAAKATFTTLLALAATWLARKSRAAVRHTMLTAAFGVLLALPIVSMVAPQVRITVSSRAPEGKAAGPVQRVGPGPATVNATPAAATPSDLLLVGWLAGTAIFLLPVAMGLWQVRSMRRSALPWREAREAVIHGRRVEVLLHEKAPGPMTCGVLRPAIVLPTDAQDWDAEDLNRAIVHELEHVRRGDWVSHCLARSLCALYWFHPLVWMAWRRLELEAELACDDAVLGGSEATAYADQLVGLARRLSTASKRPLLAMASRADLAARVGAVLDSGKRRGRAGAVPVALACAAAVLLVLIVSPLQMVAAPQDEQATRMPQLRTSSSLVTVTVTVSDPNGREIIGLTANDFSVTEDGVAQKISVFEYQKPADPSQDPVAGYYILGYYAGPQNADGQFRKIDVSVKENIVAKVRYRPGYYTRAISGTITGAPNGGGGKAVDPTIRYPVLIFKKDPEYTEEARKAKYQGTVLLRLEVNVSGQATNIQVVRSLGLGLDEKAVEAVKQWRFRPGTKNGNPIPVQVQVGVDFRLL